MQKPPINEEFRDLLIRDFLDDVQHDPMKFYYMTHDEIRDIFVNQLGIGMNYSYTQLAYLIKALYEISLMNTSDCGAIHLELIFYLEKERLLSTSHDYVCLAEQIEKGNSYVGKSDIHGGLLNFIKHRHKTYNTKKMEAEHEWGITLL